MALNYNLAKVYALQITIRICKWNFDSLRYEVPEDLIQIKEGKERS
jgi:hypothetical protein